MVQSNSPQALISQAKNGSIEALNTLLDAYKQHIYAIAYALLNDRQKAEQAMQESVISVWKSIGNLKESESFDNWLYHITYTISNRMRASKSGSLKDKTDKLIRRSAALSNLMLPQRYAEQDDLKDRLSGIISSLPDKQREILVLYYYHQKTVDDIARITDNTERKAQSLLYLSHHTVRESIIAQEQENGEEYFTTEVPAVSLGSFITYYIDRNLPSPEKIDSIVNRSRNEAYFSSAPAPAPIPAAQNEKPAVKTKVKPQRSHTEHRPKHIRTASSDDPSTAPKDYSSVIKIVVAVLIILILSCIGILAYNTYLSPGLHRDDDTAPAPADAATEKTDIASTAPTVDLTEAPTVAPTEADLSAAYSAYKEVLEENADAIQSYNWQFRVDPTHPIAFADVMGDSTPEMIYLYATQIGDGGDLYMSMRVMTFDGTKAVEAYDLEMQDNTRRSGGIYCVTQMEDSKDLYLFFVTSPGQLRTQTAYHYTDNGDNTLKQEEAVLFNPNSGDQRVNGKDVSADESESAYNDLASKSALLLLSSSDSRGVSFPSILGIDAENAAKTYDEAIAYLSENQ